MSKPDAPNPAGDLENQPPPAAAEHILQRWKRGDRLARSSLGLRCAALVFSALAFVVMATNKHGDWRQFDNYEEYRYVLAVAIVSTLYSGFQVFRQLRDLSTAGEATAWKYAGKIDFLGDQIVAYLLISAASSAIPLTNRMREGSDNIFTDSSAAAIGMEIFAFLALGLSALISGYKLSRQTYI